MRENTTERKRLFHLVMFFAPISCLPKVTLQTELVRGGSPPMYFKLRRTDTSPG